MFQPRQSRTAQTHRSALSVTLSVLIVVCAIVGHARPRFPQKSMAENLHGKPLDPFAVSANRVVVLLFVRTDCPISNRYAPLLQKLSEEFRGRAVFWLVYPDRAETASQIKTHLQDYHYSIAALRDTDHALVRRAQATTTPEAAVFDSSGLLLYHGRIDNSQNPDAIESNDLRNALDSSLAGKPVEKPEAKAFGCSIKRA